MLYRLPNGHWITLTCVTAIRCFDRSEYLPTARVDIYQGTPLDTLLFDSLSAAIAYGDELATKVNEAKSVADALVSGREE